MGIINPHEDLAKGNMHDTVHGSEQDASLDGDKKLGVEEVAEHYVSNLAEITTKDTWIPQNENKSTGKVETAEAKNTLESVSDYVDWLEYLQKRDPRMVYGLYAREVYFSYYKAAGGEMPSNHPRTIERLKALDPVEYIEHGNKVSIVPHFRELPKELGKFFGKRGENIDMLPNDNQQIFLAAPPAKTYKVLLESGFSPVPFSYGYGQATLTTSDGGVHQLSTDEAIAETLENLHSGEHFYVRLENRNGCDIQFNAYADPHYFVYHRPSLKEGISSLHLGEGQNAKEQKNAFNVYLGLQAGHSYERSNTPYFSSITPELAEFFGKVYSFGNDIDSAFLVDRTADYIQLFKKIMELHAPSVFTKKGQSFMLPHKFSLSDL